MKKVIKSILKEEVSGMSDTKLKKILSKVQKVNKITSLEDLNNRRTQMVNKVDGYGIPEPGKVVAYLSSNFREDGDYSSIDTLVVPEILTFEIDVTRWGSAIVREEVTYVIDAWSKEEAENKYEDGDYDYDDAEWGDHDYQDFEEHDTEIRDTREV